jgi:tRNA1(Val) A37 N6-methylase TrmN6
MLDDDPLTDDAITARYRVLQRVRGHRYSLDDVVVAWEAARAVPGAARVCDLGTGIGSVALMLAHALPDAAIEAIEAQDVSYGLLARNVERNGLGGRVRIHQGDLRDPALGERLGAPFDLVTGTPPYFPVGTCTIPPDSQRAHARVELRGGVESYLRAARGVVKDDGLVCVCADAQKPERVLEGARVAGLFPRTRRDVVPRAGKGALVGVWTFTPCEGGFVHHPDLVARDEQGARTPVQHALRAFFGLSIRESEPPSPPRASQPPRSVS